MRYRGAFHAPSPPTRPAVGRPVATLPTVTDPGLCGDLPPCPAQRNRPGDRLLALPSGRHGFPVREVPATSRAPVRGARTGVMTFATLAVILAAGILGPVLAWSRHWQVPVVIGELIAGVLLGRTGIGYLHAANPGFVLLANLGFALVMFVAGSHVPMRNPALRPALRTGLLRAVVVGVAAAVLGVALAAWFGTGHGAMYAVLMASSSAALILPIVDSLRLGTGPVLEMLPQVAIADTVCIVALPLAIDPARAVRAAVGAVAVLAAAGLIFVVLRDFERSRAAPPGARRVREAQVRARTAHQPGDPVRARRAGGPDARLDHAGRLRVRSRGRGDRRAAPAGPAVVRPDRRLPRPGLLRLARCVPRPARPGHPSEPDRARTPARYRCRARRTSCRAGSGSPSRSACSPRPSWACRWPPRRSAPRRGCWCLVRPRR